MKKILTVAALGLALGVTGLPQTASALTLNYGNYLVAIDGNADANVTVDTLNVGGTQTYTYGYFLNGSSTFSSVSPLSFVTFTGGDVIDFALYDGTRYYTLSGDLADPTYSVTMTLANQVTVGAPQQPANWNAPYFYNVNITWNTPDIIDTNSLALNFTNNANDGIGVPEPSTLLILGSGLTGVVALGRFRRKK